ncbi:isoflavone reductase family protein [Lindgomyces ingoldianus]|uniref:Isoflavone reductase family protein n=1 Tax=Lindgomyces ingoldianus TaxID=673940 RepID=A0ACB6QHY1_9PLEO|nr:isoflavone reductase family protein [Lindgomyces ingoldianus]KAF2466609.1 isoflavone reductase family protein [Lindgomyces ingoldianus]
MANEAPIPKKILLFGATGVIGKYILNALIEAKSSFEKIGIFTSPETVKSKADIVENLKTKGVDVVVGNVDSEEDVSKAFEDYDTIISALGRSVLLTQIPLLTLAARSPNIHTFYPSEYGTDIEYSPASATEKPHQMKLAVRKHIHENIDTDRLKITHLVTGPYSDLYIGKMVGAEEVGSFDVREKKAVLLGTGEERVSFTTMRDVGNLLVAALNTPFPSSSSSRILKVNSFTTTPRSILTEFEKQTNGKWEVSYTSLDKLKELEAKAWEEKSPIAAVYTLRRIWTQGGTLYEGRDNGKIGDPKMETLEEQVRKAVEIEVRGV